MADQFSNEPMLDVFLFEAAQLTNQLEELILNGEKEGCLTQADINEIFRIMHTIKGSAAMMMFQSISVLAHSLEDIFYLLRERIPENIDYSALSDLVLGGIDFIKVELEKIRNGDEADGNPESLLKELKNYLSVLNVKNETKPDKGLKPKKAEKQQFYIHRKGSRRAGSSCYRAAVSFEDGCEMENIRAYTIIHNLKDITDDLFFIPTNILDSDESISVIRRDGFIIYLSCSYSYEQLKEMLNQTIFLKELELTELNEEDFIKASGTISNEPEKEDSFDRQEIVKEDAIADASPALNESKVKDNEAGGREPSAASTKQSIISVSVTKLDKLMDLVGEMVIAEAMVIQNPDLAGLQLNSFEKAARQLNKITNDMQDMVMSIRMVPLSITFNKMNRIIRDMSKKLSKEVNLVILGEETEVDKNIIEHISDPLMHLIRNSVDHGLETAEERRQAGKPPAGTITLEAKNAGSDVLITVSDDGRGLNKEKILSKAREHGLLYKNAQEMTDREIFNLILLPGFSTKDNVTEYSGRGVGMDVVTKNIETLGGSLQIDSSFGRGTVISMKIPLTLAIIDGMNIRVGSSFYTIPTISIKESFRPRDKDLITDPEGNEMLMVRGQCFKLIKLHELFKVSSDITDPTKGIIIMAEQDEKTICLLADELVGQQQVVVKALPGYIQEFKRIQGLAGCTLLGDGSISLILDIGKLVNM